MQFVRFLSLFLTVSFLGGMQEPLDGFPDPAVQEWFGRLPQYLRDIALSWDKQDGRIFIVTATLKRVDVQKHVDNTAGEKE